MNREQAKATAKGMIEEYLSRKGINTRKPFACLNPQHNDRNPSMSLDRKHNRAKCFACGVSYDIFDLIAIDYGLTDQKEVFDKAYEVLGIKADAAPRKATAQEDFKETAGQSQDKTGQPTHKETDFTGYYEECRRRINETDYHRGLSAETLERHHVGYDPAFRTKDSSGNDTQWRALIIPTGRSSYQARNTDPNAGHRDRYRKRGESRIFSYKTLRNASSPIFVVEGEIDAMSIEEVGGAAVGLGSMDNVQPFLRLLETMKPSQPLIIALDNEAEETKQERVIRQEQALTEGLERLQIPYYRLQPYGAYKDANEALTKDREAFTEAIAGAADIEHQAEEEERESYLTNSAGAHLQEFINGITESVNTDAIPTGFETLDNVLDGGLYEGLITVGAISSLGKTSLILQVADQVARAGNDVLIFSLEMARTELMSKSISRHTLQLALAQGVDARNAKTARGITAGKRYVNYNQTEQKLIYEAINEYSTYAERIFITEGIGNIGAAEIRTTIEKHIKITGRKPLVIVDYLQIVAPYSERMSDKQNTDKAVLELKRISRDLKLPVVAISSFNRTSYQAEAAFEAFKESGAIEYGSDIVIGLQLKGAGEKGFDPTEAKKRNPRQVELVILKNRSGKVGDKILFDYYPMFNYFTDKGLST